MRDVVLSEPAEPKPTATSAFSDPVAPAQAPADVVRAPVGPVKILFFSANTKDGDQLALDEEYRAIEQRIRLARHRDAFQPIFKPAARRDDLQDALLEHSPHVVHFACHGSSQAEIVLRSDGPASDPVAADSLASLFGVLHNNVVLVVFNACFASAQASAILRSAKVAIGMRSRIEDGAAITFASALYGALAYGCSVQDAFTLGVAALDARQRQLPELFVRPGVDASKVVLVKPRRSRTLLMVLVAAVAGIALVAVGGRRLWPDLDPLRHHPPLVRIEPAPWSSANTPSAGSSVAGSDAPFVLETTLRARRTQHGQPITLDEIHSGDIVQDGDRLQLTVRTSQDGYLYLAFCSQQARDPRYRGLSVFPDNGGGIPVVANQPTLAPARDAEIVLDNQPGPEALYLILSRHELSRADTGLADVLAAARRGREATDCGASFQAAVAGSRKGTTGGPVLHTNPDLGKPVVEIQRGAYVEFGGAQSGVEADPDGIVILRYELKHISAGR